MCIRDSLGGLKRLKFAYWGMQLAHLGVAVLLVGVTFTVALSVQKDVRMEAGDEFEVNGYLFSLDQYHRVMGPNYVAEEGIMSITRDGAHIADIFPQKRTYLAGGQTMTEAGIVGNLWRDLYVSMGEPLEDGAWSIRLYVKPFVRWVWYGAALMAIGAVVSVFDRRYRSKPKQEELTANFAPIEA